MADTPVKPDQKTTPEGAAAAAKARAAERTQAAAAQAGAAEGGDEGLAEAAQRFQTLKAGQKAGPSRKDREAALLNQAVTVSPRASIEKLPQATPVKAEPLAINRREFLTYAWGAALALVGLEGVGSTLWFMYPRFRPGEFGGVFTVTTLPAVGAKPAENLSGKFWWAQTEEGMKAIYKVCTHLGCLYEWKEQTGRFECPCHGSKFLQDGRRIAGPATRDLDEFVVTAEDANGAKVDQTTPEKRYVTAKDGLLYRVDTGRKLTGLPKDPALQLQE